MSGLRYNIILYEKNTRAIRFYRRENVTIQSEGIEDNTAEKECTMVWSRYIQNFEKR